MVYLYDDIQLIDFEITKGVFGKGSKANVRVKWSDVGFSDVGDLVKIYIFDKLVFSGMVKIITRKYVLGDINIVGDEIIFYKKYERKKLYPEDLGFDGEMEISEIVKYIVDKYSNFIYTYIDDDGNIVNTIQPTGVKITKFIINEYLSNALDRLAKTVGYVWYVKNGVFYFEKPKYADSSITLNNKNAVFKKWQELSDKLANDLHLLGANVEYERIDGFRGDGSTTEFRLSYIPTGTVKVFVDGNELSYDEYEVDYDKPSIIFKEPPPAYDSSSDEPLAEAYPGWMYKRKITISIDSNANPSSRSNPVFIIKSKDLDWTNFNPDYSDVRFAIVDGGGNVTELPGGFIGLEKGNYAGQYYRIFWFRYNSTVNTGDSIDVYMIYGNSEATKKYDWKDYLIVYDEFNEYGSIGGTSLWWQPTGFWRCCRWLPDGTADCCCNGNFDVDFRADNGVACLVPVDELGSCEDDYFLYVSMSVSSKQENYGDWVVEKSNGYYEAQHVNNVILHTDLEEGSCFKGVYKAENFDLVNVTIGDRELNAEYNVEVRYTFKAPIYVHMKDDTSISKYGIFSKVVRANWITDWDMAYLMASKYISEYKDPKYSTSVKLPLKSVIDWELEPGRLVDVDDSLHGMNGSFVIYGIKMTPKICELNIGSVAYNVFAWGAKVEERIRQLETGGDENFYIPERG